MLWAHKLRKFRAEKESVDSPVSKKVRDSSPAQTETITSSQDSELDAPIIFDTMYAGDELEMSKNKEVCSESESILCKLIHPLAQIPIKSSPGAAGFDLISPKAFRLDVGGCVEVDTGVCLHIPNGYYGAIKARSGLMFKKRVGAFQGTIDSDYRGPITVLLYNAGVENVDFHVGERIAQIVMTKIHPDLEMGRVESLQETERGASGFGSIGS